jgi:hypothetical protein
MPEWVHLQKKKVCGRQPQGAWCQDEFIGSKVTLTLTAVSRECELVGRESPASEDRSH